MPGTVEPASDGVLSRQRAVCNVLGNTLFAIAQAFTDRPVSARLSPGDQNSDDGPRRARAEGNLRERWCLTGSRVARSGSRSGVPCSRASFTIPARRAIARLRIVAPLVRRTPPKAHRLSEMPHIVQRPVAQTRQLAAKRSIRRIESVETESGDRRGGSRCAPPHRSNPSRGPSVELPHQEGEWRARKRCVLFHSAIGDW
jgi:hypothetical protein